MILTRKDLTKNSRGKSINDLDMSDFSTSTSQIETANKVTFNDIDGAVKILKDRFPEQISEDR